MANINGIVINEIFADPTGGSGAGRDTNNDGSLTQADDFIELFNTSGVDVDISGWTLSDDRGPTRINDPDGYAFPSGTIIPAGGRVVLVSDYPAPLPSGFYSLGQTGMLINSGEIVTLSDGINSITASYDDLTDTGSNHDNFGPVERGESATREPDGSNNFASAAPTPECFLTGTRILTESGYQLVEELSIGDKVQTAEGNFVDIKWIGYQTIDPNALAIPLRGNPVLVKAGALGESLPARDLYISPDHSLFVDGLLINAGALVNGISILQTEPTEVFVYHSVELESHDLLTVEGTQAESYMPHHEDRANYDNVQEYEDLYPHGSNLMLWPMDYPRISSKTQVPSFVSQKLLNIAQQLEGKVLASA